MSAELNAEANTLETLNGGDITLLPDGLLSIDEHARRAEVAAEALSTMYDNFVTYYDVSSQKIQVEITLPADETEVNKTVIANVMQKHVRAEMTKNGKARFQGKAALIQESDIELTILTGSDPIITFEHSRGGNWLRDGNSRECTSGWSVVKNGGQSGIITAGHCSGLDTFEEEPHLTYGMSYKGGHLVMGM